ncbi:hypothetical protein OAV62_01380 [bacterium]|nr:hypothetical protein [bacterium]
MFKHIITSTIVILFCNHANALSFIVESGFSGWNTSNNQSWPTGIDGQQVLYGGSSTGDFHNDTSLATFNIGLLSTGVTGVEYSADWLVDFQNETVLASNVLCIANTSNSALSGCNTLFQENITTDVSINYIGASVTGGFDIILSANDFAETVHQFSYTVPIPATAWLFFSALIGITGLKRKTK